jgi:hypothetical protein
VLQDEDSGRRVLGERSSETQDFLGHLHCGVAAFFQNSAIMQPDLHVVIACVPLESMLISLQVGFVSQNG